MTTPSHNNADLTSLPLPLVSDTSVQDFLLERHYKELPYTRLGARTLISVNPKTLSSADDDSTSQQYVQLYKDGLKEQTSPHIFELAGRIYYTLRRTGEDQAVVVNGISGSGKSFTMQCLVQQFFALSNKSSKDIKLMSQVLAAQDLIKLFSSTEESLVNTYLELQFSSRGRIIGSKWLHFGLQKHKVASATPEESNMKIFYILINNRFSEELQELNLKDVNEFAYLANRKPNDDLMLYDELVDRLKSVGIRALQRKALFRLLAAVIHLGNLNFEDQGDQEACKVTNYDQLEICAQLLGVSPSALSTALTYETKLSGSDLCTVFLNCENARFQRDNLACTLYALIFSWMVESINKKLCLADSDFCNTISLLDTQGIRQSTVNSSLKQTPTMGDFDAFCANFIAERVQQYVNNRTFQNELYDKMLEDSIHAPKVMLGDYSQCLELLRGGASAGVGGIIGLISDEQSTKANISDTIEKLNFKFGTNPKFLSNGPNAFGLVHFAGKHYYNDVDFVRKNDDKFSSDFVNLARKSKVELLVEILESASLTTEAHPRYQKTVVAAQHSSKPMRQPSRRQKSKEAKDASPEEVAVMNAKRTGVLKQIDQTLTELFESMNERISWIVMCLNPNDEVKSTTVNTRFVEAQVKSFLLPDIVRQKVMDGGYTFWCEHQKFIDKYRVVIQGADIDSTRSSKKNVEAVSAVFGWDKNDLLIGDKYTYISDKVWTMLEDNLRQAEKEAKLNKTTVGTDYADSDIGSNYGDDHKLFESFKDTADYEMSEYGASQSYTSRDGLGNKGQQDQEEPETVEELEMSKQRKSWLCCVNSCTACIPNSWLARGGMSRPDVQLAWREKFTLCLLILYLSFVVIGIIVLLPLILCPPVRQYAPEEFAYHQGTETGDDIWMGLYGKVYDLSAFSKQGHGAGSTSFGVTLADMASFAGQDVSYLFPIPLTEGCKGLVNNNLVAVENNMTMQFAQAAHYSGPQARDPTSKMAQPNWFKNRVINRFNRKGILQGDIAFEPARVKKDAKVANRRWFILDDVVYDLTYYFSTIQNHPATGPGVPNYRYLGSGFEDLVNLYSGQDISDMFKMIKPASQQPLIRNCLKNVFLVGIVDTRKSIKCQISDYLLLSTSMVLVAVILVKFLAALQLGSRRAPEECDKFVICQVPCYTEGEDSLKKTIDSLAALNYDDKRKLIFIIADGMIVGGGNDRPTPRIVLDILGVDPNYDPEPLAFKSVAEGMKQLNYGKVYSGLYEHEGHVVPYMVVVKVGRPSETARPGNRGKRDSQIILLQFLNRVARDTAMCPLELEIYHQMKNVIGVDPALYEYILMVDADTEVMEDSLTRLVSCMLHDQRIVGICGETRLQEEDLTWATMIQVYEYYISHHMAKAFESLFGSVTCLPGCFCMYRVRSAQNGKPLIVADEIVHDYSENHVDTLHKKNLLHLGEDRYLTTLMLKYFPEYKMTFTQDAFCRTAAPEKWSILLSQRRRWINSTVHNLFELMMLPDLCGFCCFSMRFVIFFDLFGTLVQPSMMIYLAVLIFKLIDNSNQDQPQGTNLVSLIIIAAVYGLQAFIFLVKRQWQHIGWMIIYLMATPIFCFAIPLYSFWHFDDFSWGNTRIVLGENNKVKVIVQEDEKFDPKMIPLKKWSSFEQEMWEMGSVKSSANRPVSSFYGGATGAAAAVAARFDSMYQPSLRGSMYREPSIIAPSTLPDPGFTLDAAQRFSAYSDSHRLSMAPSIMAPSVVMGEVGPSEEELLMEIRKVLETCDLMTVTKKQIREHLSAMYGVDLTARKEFINKSIELMLQGKL